MPTSTTPRRVAVFGGTFDPIHNGHLTVAEAAAAQHRLDTVIFVPARRPPHKASEPSAPAEHRLAMIRLAVEGRPGFEVSDCELTRPGTSYTVDTMRRFRRRLPPGTRLYFIAGSDSVPELPAWRDLAGLTELCTLVVAARPGRPLEELDALLEHLPEERVAAIKAAAVATTASPVSATEVRRRLAAGRPVAELVPDAVARYIAENKLYKPA